MIWLVIVFMRYITSVLSKLKSTATACNYLINISISLKQSLLVIVVLMFNLSFLVNSIYMCYINIWYAEVFSLQMNIRDTQNKWILQGR